MFCKNRQSTEDDSDFEKYLAEFEASRFLALLMTLFFEGLGFLLDLLAFFLIALGVFGVFFPLCRALYGSQHIASNIRFIPPNRFGLIKRPLIRGLLLQH